MADDRDSRFSKYILPIGFLIALAFVGVFLFGWITSDAGARQVEKIKNVAMYPVDLLFGQYDEAKRAVSWTSETNTTAQKQGVTLTSFKSLRPKITEGEELILKYNLDTNLLTDDTILTDFYCKIGDKKGEITPTNPIKITPTRTPSVRCRFTENQTQDLEGQIKVEGGLIFPYTTKDVILPVYFAREQVAEDFFENFGIKESQPIRVTYNQEPVEVAIGVSDENIQPVIVSDEENFPMIGIALHNRWGGEITEINEFKISLPKGVTIKQETPSKTCPFTAQTTQSERNTYSASLSLIETLGTSKLETFECWLNIDQTIIPYETDFTKKEYVASVSYTYKVTPKIDVVTVEYEGELI